MSLPSKHPEWNREDYIFWWGWLLSAFITSIQIVVGTERIELAPVFSGFINMVFLVIAFKYKADREKG